MSYQYKVSLGVDHYFEGYFLNHMAKEGVHKKIIMNSLVHHVRKRPVNQDKIFFQERMYEYIRTHSYISTPEDLIKLVDANNLIPRMEEVKVAAMKPIVLDLGEPNKKTARFFKKALESYKGEDINDNKLRTIAFAIVNYLNSGLYEKYVIFKSQDLLVKLVYLYKEGEKSRTLFDGIFDQIKSFPEV